jgi:hypothetical protein
MLRAIRLAIATEHGLNVADEGRPWGDRHFAESFVDHPRTAANELQLTRSQAALINVGGSDALRHSRGVTP